MVTDDTREPGPSASRDGRTGLGTEGVLPAAFEAQADARPNALAVLRGPERATYAELESLANRIARHLRAKGVGRGALVGVLLPRSVDLYATILGILKAGAAYIPIDVSYPVDRIEYILTNSRAKALVTSSALPGKVRFDGVLVRVDRDRKAIAAQSPARLPRDAGPQPRDLCYVIYTSGSTGRPKGVMVEHRNAHHLVRTEGPLYGIRSEDRVFQGASPSFDLSVEEMWLAFANGATLVAATDEMARAGPDLARLLTAAHVTVLSTVPTLLSMLDEDVPTVRILILGGEACPPQIAERWSRPGRRILNTYGPTETTVIATCAEVAPGKKVTIGQAIPGYRVDLRDANLRPVPPGEVGEISIAGAGVARGYVGLPDQTRERFVPDPEALPGSPDARMYRAGDLGRLDADGNIEFVGRGDGQVKIRGFRVELGEIEAVLAQQPGIRAAACALREDQPGVQRIIGYVVPADGSPVDELRLLARLRDRLPPYMVPSQIDTLDALPLLPTGKLDRGSLPAPRAHAARAARRDAGKGRTAIERQVLDVWGRLFQPLDVSVDDDFFLDLGGHSLLAAQAVSALRKEAGIPDVSVSDVYEHPTVRSLARVLETRHRRSQHAKASDPAPRTALPPRRRRVLAGAIQALSLYGVFAIRALAWITPYVVFFFLWGTGHSLLASTLWAIVSGLAVYPALLVAAVAAKWLILGRARPGRYPLWGGYHLRFWFVQSLVKVLPLRLMTGTPLLPAVYRMLGARIGRGVFLGTDRLGAFDVISIGDGASVNELASLNGYSIEDGELVIGPVTVGRGCFVGTWSVLGEGSSLGDYARLEELSLLPRGTSVPDGETWRGSPAKRTTPTSRAPPPRPRPGRLRRIGAILVYAGLMAVYPTLFFLAVLPAMILLPPAGLFVAPIAYLLLAPVAAAYVVAAFATLVVLLKWAAMGRARAGSYAVDSAHYVRHWFVDHLLKDSLEFLGQVYATLYTAPWYRALGARIGKNVELSTASSINPDLLELEEGSTVADEVSLGAHRVENGWMTVAPTRLGRRAFIGNTGVVPAGTALGSGSLVGVLSIAPREAEEAGQEGAAWLGSPPILLPRRQESGSFPEARTFAPKRRLKIARGLFELLRITGPTTGLFLVASFVTGATLALFHLVGIPLTLLVVPLLYALACVTAISAVALVKWAVVGRYRPFAWPLWSQRVWRLEFVNALYEFFASPLALDALEGTPFLPAYLRVLGSKIGRGVYLETTGFLEWDLVEVGDGAALMKDAVVQTHLFEDRVLKSAPLRIGRNCSVGDASVVLYGATLEDGCRLDGLSLVMKGETLPAGTAWGGVPAEWQGTANAPREEPGPTRPTALSGKRHDRATPGWSRQPVREDGVSRQGSED